MAIEVRIVGTEEVVGRLGRISAATRARLKAAVTASAVDVMARARRKLAGEVLRERTHHLHDSIHFVVTEAPGAIVGRVGTNVVYAAIHEYGFDGVESVRAHLRRVTQAFGRPIAPVEAEVRAHQRHMRMPERSFLRSSLAEAMPSIRERIAAAVAAARTAP